MKMEEKKKRKFATFWPTAGAGPRRWVRAAPLAPARVGPAAALAAGRSVHGNRRVVLFAFQTCFSQD